MENSTLQPTAIKHWLIIPNTMHNSSLFILYLLRNWDGRYHTTRDNTETQCIQYNTIQYKKYKKIVTCTMSEVKFR